MSNTVDSCCRHLIEPVNFFVGKSNVWTTKFVSDIFFLDATEKQENARSEHLCKYSCNLQKSVFRKNAGPCGSSFNKQAIKNEEHQKLYRYQLRWTYTDFSFTIFKVSKIRILCKIDSVCKKCKAASRPTIMLRREEETQFIRFIFSRIYRIIGPKLENKPKKDLFHVAKGQIVRAGNFNSHLP